MSNAGLAGEGTRAILAVRTSRHGFRAAAGIGVVRQVRPRPSVRAARAAGRLPLVFVRDNGAPYASRILALFLAALGLAAAQLNRRPRQTKKKYLPALEFRHSMCPAIALVDRETFYRAACAAMAAAVPQQAKGRARRRAERAAIFATLEQFDLIIRYRGGVRINPRVAETTTCSA